MRAALPPTCESACPHSTPACLSLFDVHVVVVVHTHGLVDVECHRLFDSHQDSLEHFYWDGHVVVLWLVVGLVVGHVYRHEHGQRHVLSLAHRAAQSLAQRLRERQSERHSFSVGHGLRAPDGFAKR